MTPREFLDQVVRPNLDGLEGNFGDLRFAFNAVLAIDALAAHIFHAVDAAAVGLPNNADDGAYRDGLAKRSSEFQLLRDIAKAFKHVRLVRGTPTIADSHVITPRSMTWDNAIWNETRWDSPLQVVVEIDGGRLRAVEGVARNALKVLDEEMTRLGL
jgi:hypothetical protein